MFGLVTSGSRGWAAHYADSGAKFIRVQNVRRRRIELDLDDVQHVRPPVNAEGARTRLQAGDVVVTITADLGRVGLIPDSVGEAYVNQHVALARPLDVRTAPYLAWFLTSTDAQDQLGLLDRGATRAGLGLKDIGAVQVPLPPLSEQRRIVARIEALSARTRRACIDLDRVAALLPRQKRAMMASAFSGELTQQWRRARGEGDAAHGEPWPIPISWEWKRVRDVGRVALGRQRSPVNHTGPKMRPYVRAANITWDGWDLSDVKEMNFAEPDFSRFRLVPGDVLLNEGSGSAAEVGKPAIWRGQIEDCCFQNTLIRVQPAACMSEYMFLYFLFSALTGKFVSETQGVNIHHIGKEGLAEFAMPVPPLAEQMEITRRLEAVLSRSGKLETERSRAAHLALKLEQAILAKAFRGELVPQDPGDEPAEALLARLQPPAANTRRRRARGGLAA